MRMIIPMLLATLLPIQLPGAVRSGKAEVALISASEGYTPGYPVMVAVRMKLDEGWHTYWTNPGEGGMPIGVKWTLPEGWEAGPLLYPVPISFKTGELPGFGYEGEVVLPVFLTPSAEAAGDVTLAVELSWLTCDDSACVPGDATVSLILKHGLGDPTPAAKDIEAALDQVPQPLDGAEMIIEEKDGKIEMIVTLPEGIDAAGARWLPASPGVVDPGEPIRPVKEDGKWRAVVTKHEYAEGAASALELVLAGGGLEAPLLLTWEKKP